MNKHISAFIIIFAVLASQGYCTGQELSSPSKLSPVNLLQPDLNKGKTLMQALKNRKSERNLSERKLTLQQLSDLLWAADGINRDDKKRTAPAALAVYSIDIYVVLVEGIYLYDVFNHRLTPVAEGDHRKQAGSQDFVYTAPLNLVYVRNPINAEKSTRPIVEEKRKTYAYMEAAFIAQNVNLYCASEGLGTTVRAYIDHEKFGKIINVSPDLVVLAQTVGYPK